MSKQSHTPNLEELEKLLQQIRPQPTQRFYQKMERQPWNQNFRFPFWKGFNQVSLAAGLSLVLILGLTLVLAAPSIDALASRIAQFFTSASNDTVTIRLPVPDFSDPAANISKSIEEVTHQAGFEVRIPSKLPQDYLFTGATYNTDRQSVTLNYQTREGSILRVTQRPAGLEYQSISVNARVDQVQIGATTGEYVAGGWRVEQPQSDSTNLTVTVQAAWDPDANIHFLRWQEEDILFEILFSGADHDSIHSLDKDDLIKIAENLEH